MKMFVIKSAMDDDEEMLESLRRESDMLVKVSPHPNITTFIGAMWEETFLESERVSQRCHLFTELAESEAGGRRRECIPYSVFFSFG